MDTIFATTALTGKVALVTGSTRGIGRAIAEALAHAGATVAINGRSAEAAQAVADALIAQGQRAVVVAADLSDPAATSALVGRVLDACGTLDILVNNAGISPVLGRPERLALDQWERIMYTNLTAPFQLAQATGQHLIERRATGSIINLASIGGDVALPGLPAYCASKAGLIGLTKSLALDWAKHSIRVNALAPGYIDTDMTAGIRQSESLSAYVMSKIPLARLGNANEVAQAAVFLASDAAAYITGHVLAVDGGWLAV